MRSWALKRLVRADEADSAGSTGFKRQITFEVAQ
jgi:hypothetical protein